VVFLCPLFSFAFVSPLAFAIGRRKRGALLPPNHRHDSDFAIVFRSLRHVLVT